MEIPLTDLDFGMFSEKIDSQPNLSGVEKSAYILGCLRGKANTIASGYHLDARSHPAVVKGPKLKFYIEAVGRRNM